MIAIKIKKVANHNVYMVKYFHFVTEDKDFHGELEVRRCKYTNPNTELRCKIRVCIGLDLCWVHNRKKLHLKIAKSQIPNAGIGLYAYNANAGNGIVFRANDKICDCTGETIDKDELEPNMSLIWHLQKFFLAQFKYKKVLLGSFQ